MKIAIVTDSLEVGGIANYTNKLAEALERLGHHTSRFESWKLDKGKISEYDVVNIHTLWRLGRLNGLPLVFSGHGRLFLLFDKRQSIRSRLRLYNVWSYISAKLYKRAIRASTAVNRLAANVIERDLGVKVDAIIPPGIDTDAFNPNVPTVNLRGNPKLIYAGPITYRKNIEELLHILNSLKVIYPDAFLQILGWVASNDYKEQLIGLQKSLGLESSVSFDFVPKEMVPRYIRSCNIYISASKEDWTPQSVYDAIACGIPVLLSDLPAHMEMIHETGGGETYHLGEPQSAIPKIQRILSNAERYDTRSKNFLAKASWDDRARQFLEVYGKAIEARRD